MRLDVIIPTYNRRRLLESALESLFAAAVPDGLDVGVAVVDNASTDGTREVVERFQERFGQQVAYVHEPLRGRSRALNAGIAATRGELVGTIDDDERIDADWYATIYQAFSAPDLDFIGGPYLPQWASPPPDWVPPEYGAVIGVVDGGDRRVPFDRQFGGILMGGNAVFRRSILERVGPYATWLGRTDRGLESCEDQELYDRLLAAGAKGLYLPALKIYHHIGPERLTKRYFRRWCLGRGISLGLLERTRRQDCAYLFGLPRWRYRSALVGLASGIGGLFQGSRRSRASFASELAFWDFLGMLYGRHVRRAPLP
jgi:glucosyl-dolichyl phosphate glucuronosyltransferase